MKKVILVVLFTILFLSSCTQNVLDTKDNPKLQPVNFLYDIKFSIVLYGSSKMYRIEVNSNSNTVELLLKYDNDDYTSDFDVFREGANKSEYTHTKNVILSLEQVKELLDIISKISYYDYADNHQIFPDTVDLSFTIYNTETNEKNKTQAGYNAIIDKNLQALVKKLVELSPVQILDYEGNLLILEDTSPRYIK